MFEEFRKYLNSKIEISDEQFREVEKLLTFKAVRHGEKLLSPGETSLFGIFVMKGCLRSYVIHDNREHIMQFAPENWWIGDNHGIISPEPALFFIDAIEDSRVALFDHEFIGKFVKIVPEAFEMHQKLQQNAFRSLQYRVIRLLTATAEERYISFINSYPNLATRLPQRMIASFLGIAPQSLSRVRAHFLQSSGEKKHDAIKNNLQPIPDGEPLPIFNSQFLDTMRAQESESSF